MRRNVDVGPRGNFHRALSPSQSTTILWGCGFYAMRDRNEPGDLRFGPCVIEDVESWKYLLSGNGKLSSPGAAGHRRWPDGQLSLCVGSPYPGRVRCNVDVGPRGNFHRALSPSQSTTIFWGCGFYAMRDRNEPGDLRFGPCVIEDVESWKYLFCLLYTSPSPRDLSTSRMPSSA